MPIHRYKYLSSSDAARMSKLQLTARQVVEGVITGLHKSPHRGFSAEFSEHREYVAGDEIRHLDWRAYARSDRYYVKLYEQETNLRATIVLDNSASMKFAGKIDYARQLAACLAYLFSKQQDLAGLTAVDESVRIDIPPGSSGQHLDRLFRELENLQVGKTTDLPKQLHDLAERLPRRSLVVILSDLWTDAAQLARAARHLVYRRHQAIVLHLLDKSEINLTPDRPLTLVDLETDEKLQINPADLRESYGQQVAAHLAAVRRACNDSNVEYQLMHVDEPCQRALVRWLNRRRK